MKKLLVVLSLFLITATVSFGQFKRQREYSGFFDTYYYRGPLTFTAGAGMTTYRGDLTEGFGTNGLSFGMSVGANYKLWPHLVFGAELSYLNFQSTDFKPERNASFVGHGYELQAYGRLYLIDEIVRIAPDRRKESHYTFCKPYIHLGVGAMMFNSTTTFNNAFVSNAEIKSPSTIALALPAGFGLQFTITQRSSLCVEYVYRFTTTDNLDNMTYSGSRNDGYGTFQCKFQFAPSAPKRKKKLSLPPPAQYDGPKGTDTWKTKKKEEQQNNARPQEEYVPENTDQGDENTEENPDGEQTEEEQVPEEPVEEEVAPE